jgi:transposase
VKDRATIVFVDESGFYLLPGRVRTYAPCGETPVLRVPETRDHLSVMSGVTMAGQLFTRVRAQALTSVDATSFLAHLVRHLGKVLVIWDGSPIHKGEVRTYLQQGRAKQVHLERLPPYAPELNPDEGVWQQLKNVELRNVCCANLAHLGDELHLAIGRLRYRPNLIQACFQAAGLPINRNT